MSLSDSRRLWLPIVFPAEGSEMCWRAKWRLDDLASGRELRKLTWPPAERSQGEARR